MTHMFCPFHQVAVPGVKSAVSDCILLCCVKGGIYRRNMMYLITHFYFVVHCSIKAEIKHETMCVLYIRVCS